MRPNFAQLADLLPEPMALVAPDGTIHAANRAFSALLSAVDPTRGAGSLAQAGWFNTEGWPDYLSRCARTRSLVVGSARRAAADGQEVVYRCEGALYEPRSDDTEPLVLLRLLAREFSSSRFVALTQKIDELSSEILRRQRAEEQAHEQRELLHVTLSSIGDAVIATDRVGLVTFMNDVAEHLTGWSLPEATGVPVRDIFRIINEETRQAVDDPVTKVLALGMVVGLANHTLLIARDGTERPIDDSGSPIVDPQGQLHGVVLVFRDVTELRAAERQQVAARLAAEAANRAKDEFLATLSHELRTPLNAILGWTRMLLRGAVEESRRSHALTVIERNAEMQARLVEDLLEVSRIMVGQLRLQYAPVDLRQIIEASLDAVRPAADNKGLTVVTGVRVSSAVYGDAARLQQVIWNLLTNAVKFTPRGGRVSIDAIEGDGTVRIDVSDTGEGIPSSFQSRVFDAFSQADGSFGRPHGGLGLGLTIVRQLIEAHGGHVAVTSGGEKQGATFTVTLPINPLPLPEPRVSVAPPPQDIQGCRILVVEGDADASDLTKALLEEAGAAVVACARSRDALEEIERGQFDVLVADIGLPGEDGLWLIQQIRRLDRPESSAIPAIAVTAFGSVADRQAALAAGYHEHVPKPPDLDVLIRTIGRMWRRDTTPVALDLHPQDTPAESV